MSSATSICAGCGGEFTPRGYSNHLQLSYDPRCSSFRDELVYKYTTPLTNQSPDPLHTPHPITPDVQMLDISNEEPTPEPNISPSFPHEAIDMSINSDDGADGDIDDIDDNDSDNADDDDENTGLGDEEGDTNQPFETVFHRPTNSAAATVDSDTESETSDEELEHQPVSPLNVENGPSNTQTGRCSHCMLGYLTSTEPLGTCHRRSSFCQVRWDGREGATSAPDTRGIWGLFPCS